MSYQPLERAGLIEPYEVSQAEISDLLHYPFRLKGLLGNFFSQHHHHHLFTHFRSKHFCVNFGSSGNRIAYPFCLKVFLGRKSVVLPPFEAPDLIQRQQYHNNFGRRDAGLGNAGPSPMRGSLPASSETTPSPLRAIEGCGRKLQMKRIFLGSWMQLGVV
jgi:hypothetical protein